MLHGNIFPIAVVYTFHNLIMRDWHYWVGLVSDSGVTEGKCRFKLLFKGPHYGEIVDFTFFQFTQYC